MNLPVFPVYNQRGGRYRRKIRQVKLVMLGVTIVNFSSIYVLGIWVE